MASSSIYRGWNNDLANTRLQALYNGTSCFDITATSLTTRGSSGLTVETGGLTVTAGGLTITADDVKTTVGNYRAGPVNAFGTTEPTQAVVLEAGTAAAGAITTSSGIFSSSTVLRKIIADGTVSNVG